MSAPQPRMDANLALAKAMGSTRGYDPMPPDQHEWQQTKGEPPLYRLWSWMCAHTIRRGHRSPYAVTRMAKNEDGSFIRGTERAVTLKDAAEDLHITLQQLSALWKLGEERGLWRREGGRQLFLNGGVSIEKITIAKERRKVKRTNNLSPAERLKIKDWEKQRQDEFYALWEPAQEYREKLAAAAIAEAREACDRIEDNIRRAFELPKTRLPRRRLAAPEIPPQLQLFVQSERTSLIVQASQVVSTNGEETGEKLTVRATAIRNAENYPENYSAPRALTENQNGSVGRSFAESDRPADPVPFPSNQKPEDARMGGVHALLCEKSKALELHEEPSRALCLQIVVRLAGAPLENLRAAMETPRRRKKLVEMGLGLCRELAYEVGTTWRREAGARERMEKARAADEARAAEQTLAFEAEAPERDRAAAARKRKYYAELEQIVKNKSAPEKERAQARLIIESRKQDANYALHDPDAGPEEKKLAREILGGPKTIGEGT